MCTVGSCYRTDGRATDFRPYHIAGNFTKPLIYRNIRATSDAASQIVKKSTSSKGSPFQRTDCFCSYLINNTFVFGLLIVRQRLQQFLLRLVVNGYFTRSSAKSRFVSLSYRHLISNGGSPNDYLMAESTTSRSKKENYSLQAGLCKGILIILKNSLKNFPFQIIELFS